MLFRFRKFTVYIKAKELRAYAKVLLKKFPSSERFVLTDQINRAINSICLNIAEGSNRSTDKDKAHFMNQALTSLEEVISAFDLALDDGYINQNEMNKVLVMGENLGKQLISFSKTLLRS
jgi:four helix bundle protein